MILRQLHGSTNKNGATGFDAHDLGLYAADSFHLRILRIDPQAGAREVIASDALLFNFPVRLQFLAPACQWFATAAGRGLRSRTSTGGKSVPR
jgi:hypothetical protein